MNKFVTLFYLLTICMVGSTQERGIKLLINLDGQPTVLYDKSYALVIGISDYNNGWPKLSGVIEDINTVKSALEQNGFIVDVLLNADKNQVDKVISTFISQYGQAIDNRLLIYFAGHGYTVKTSYGEYLGYIVPVNAPDPNIDIAGFQEKSIEMAQIEIYARRIQSKHALFMFDACFAGSLFEMRSATSEAITYKTTKQVRQFITSGSADEQVPDKSIFCKQFVTAITTDEADYDKDGYLTGSELGFFLQNKVVNYSYNTQHPQYGKIRNPNLDKGDFVFQIPTKIDIDTLKREKVLLSKTNGGELEIEQNLDVNGTLNLFAEISGKFYIDEVFYGKVEKGSSYVFKEISPGLRTLSIIGDTNWNKNALINRGEVSTIFAKIEKGSVDIFTEVKGELFFDNVFVQKIESNTHINLKDIVAGYHTVEIKGRRPYFEKINVTPKEVLPLTIEKTKLKIEDADFIEELPNISLAMIYIFGGDYKMGCNKPDCADCSDFEMPMHDVHVSSFHISKYEVTVKQFSAFINDTKYITDAERNGFAYKLIENSWEKGDGLNWRYSSNGRLLNESEWDKPVLYVSWNDAVAFCSWMSSKTGSEYRLPTESEWEFAAKGGIKSKGYKFSGSNDVNEIGWFMNNSNNSVQVVGRKKPNELGLHDMNGNAWEWCADDWHLNYRNAPSNSIVWNDFPISESKVLRGGSWTANTRSLWVTYRNSGKADNANSMCGFRVALVID